jgi:hypothetical protein
MILPHRVADESTSDSKGSAQRIDVLANGLCDASEIETCGTVLRSVTQWRESNGMNQAKIGGPRGIASAMTGSHVVGARYGATTNVGAGSTLTWNTNATSEVTCLSELIVAQVVQWSASCVGG